MPVPLSLVTSGFEPDVAVLVEHLAAARVDELPRERQRAVLVALDDEVERGERSALVQHGVRQPAGRLVDPPEVRAEGDGSLELRPA